MKSPEKAYNYRWEAVIARVPDSCAVAEIGVWRGQMSYRLLSSHPGMFLVMVDWWQTPPAGHSYFDGSIKIAQLQQEDLDKAYEEAVERTKEFSDRIDIVRMESTAAAEEFEDGTFDLVFLDDDHSYMGLMRSGGAWYSKVKPGGYIGGHDYDHPEQGEVKKAVHTLFKHRLDDLELDVNRTWFIQVK